MSAATGSNINNVPMYRNKKMATENYFLIQWEVS